MTILVTGASGFLGSAVVRALLASGEDLRVLTRKNSDTTNIESLELDISYGDLRDPESLAKACKGCRGLYHVAADYRLWTRDERELYDSNVEGTRNIMRAAMDAEFERVVYTSSVATLGVYTDGRAANEDTPVSLDNMIGHYKRSKYLAERVVDDLVAKHQLPAVIVNPSTPIGPRDVKPTPTGRVIRDAACGRIPAFVDTGLNVAHVDDVAQGHLLAWQRGAVGRRYILGGDDLSLREILAMVAHDCGRRPPRVQLPRRALFPIAALAQGWASLTNGPEPQVTIDGLRMAAKKMFFESSRAEDELGYQHRPAQAAIIDALKWFRERGELN